MRGLYAFFKGAAVGRLGPQDIDLILDHFSAFLVEADFPTLDREVLRSYILFVLQLEGDYGEFAGNRGHEVVVDAFTRKGATVEQEWIYLLGCAKTRVFVGNPGASSLRQAWVREKLMRLRTVADLERLIDDLEDGNGGGDEIAASIGREIRGASVEAMRGPLSPGEGVAKSLVARPIEPAGAGPSAVESQSPPP